MDSVTDDRVLICRVSPFGNLRIDAYVPLPVAYRSLSRPSSAPDAKAFPLRSFSLNRSGSLNYAGSFRISSKLFYPFKSSTIASEFPSVALLVFPLFSFQCADRRCKLRIVRSGASARTHFLRCISSSSRTFVARMGTRVTTCTL